MLITGRWKDTGSVERRVSEGVSSSSASASAFAAADAANAAPAADSAVCGTAGSELDSPPARTLGAEGDT